MSSAAALTPEAQALIDHAHEHQRALNRIATDLARMQIITEFGTDPVSRIGTPNTEMLSLSFKLVVSPTRSERVR